MGRRSIEVIRSVTHLVLTPGPQSSFSESVFSFLYIKSFFVFSCLFRMRPSRCCGTRKRSVPVRVHSVGKSFGFVGTLSAPTANTWWTRDTVESPAKLLGSFSC
jgi:hypothetical protein